MRHFWRSLSRGKQIALSVIAAHFFCLLVLTIHHFATNRKPPQKPMAIHTVQRVSSIKSQPAPSPRPKPKRRPSSKQKSAATRTKKETIPSTLDQLNKSLDAISSPLKPSKSSPLSVPKPLSLPTPAQTTEDSSYAESLIAIFQNTLDLPEFGEVKAHLELTPDGTLKHVEILEAKSVQNAEFLKKRLPELLFPCFNGEDKKHLTVVFRNVEDR